MASGAAGRDDDKDERLCPLCLEDFADAGRVALELPCSHRFHRRCVARWLQKHSSCPCCRARAAEPAGGGSSQRTHASNFTVGVDRQTRASLFTAGRECFTAGARPTMFASGFTDTERQHIRASGFTSTDSPGQMRGDGSIRALGSTLSARGSMKKKRGL